MSERPTWILLMVFGGGLVIYLAIRGLWPFAPRISGSQTTSSSGTTSVSSGTSRSLSQTRLSQSSAQPMVIDVRKRTGMQQQRSRNQHAWFDPHQGWIGTWTLLSAAQVQHSLRITSPLRVTFLQGIPRSREYDAVQFLFSGTDHAEARFGSYVLGLQIWVESSSESLHRWNRQMKTYPRVKPESMQVMSIPLFWSFRSKIHYLNGRCDGKSRSLIFSLTCHQSFCPQGQFLLGLAKQIQKRWQTLHP